MTSERRESGDSPEILKCFAFCNRNLYCAVQPSRRLKSPDSCCAVSVLNAYEVFRKLLTFWSFNCALSVCALFSNPLAFLPCAARQTARCGWQLAGGGEPRCHTNCCMRHCNPSSSKSPADSGVTTGYGPRKQRGVEAINWMTESFL